MPAPTTTGGAMGYPTSVDSGQVPPEIIAAEAIAVAGVITATITANAVYLYGFELAANVSIASVRWRMGATTTGHTNMGIYTYAGNLVSGSDTGSQVNTLSALNSFSYATPIPLSPGQYFLALACDNSTDTYLALSGATTFSESMTRHRVAANSLAAGALPLTTGAISATVKELAVAAIPVGGLV